MFGTCRCRGRRDLDGVRSRVESGRWWGVVRDWMIGFRIEVEE